MRGMTDILDLELAQSLDAADPLCDKRAQFALPAGVIYLNGN